MAPELSILAKTFRIVFEFNFEKNRPFAYRNPRRIMWDEDLFSVQTKMTSADNGMNANMLAQRNLKSQLCYLAANDVLLKFNREDRTIRHTILLISESFMQEKH